MEKVINPRIRTEIVQKNVEANNGNQSHNFDQLPNIREAARIINIEAYDNSQVAITLNGKAVISNAVLKKSYLKLVELGGSNAEVHVYPLYSLQKTTQQTEIKDINCQAIDWEKSTIVIFDPAGVNANDSFLFKVVYEKKQK